VVAHAEATDLADVIGSALRRASKVLGLHTVKVEMKPDLPMPKLDAVLLEQVMFNLLDNAAKYAPANSEIAVTAFSDGAVARIEVRDEGEGIPPGDLERIFDKFYRVHAADRRRAGTGLGLAICRGFIEAMGGTITARNREDRSGAVFTVTLPAEASKTVPQEIVA
jgi:two-component system sensor histidine kinase KdpD